MKAVNANPSGDRAGHAYWDDGWKSAPPVQIVDPSGPGRWNYPNRQLEKLIRQWLGAPRPASRLLELGCARSIWLPYFAQRHGYAITGIDYSDTGCEQTRQMLRLVGVRGEVVRADFFAPPAELLGTFEAVFSCGVAEHFDDTAACISAFAAFLASGGRMVTVIPNVNGVPGFIQKRINKPVYDKHVPLSAAELESAHRAAGLVVEACGYCVSSNFGVLNLIGLPSEGLGFRAKRKLLDYLCRASLLGWYVDEHVAPLPATELLGAYVYCVARRA